MKIFKKQILYIMSSFLAGFSVMTVELVSSRIVAPIIGASVFTWTSVIGITLTGLAFGSYLGGKIADKKDPNKLLPFSFLISSMLVSIIPTLVEHTSFITNSSNSVLWLNLYLSIYLFLLPTMAIGLIQPIILKNFADDFSKIGSKYGTLSFAWSAGGILGVFLTGFYFISNIGSRETIWLMAIVLFAVGIVFAFKDKKIFLIFLVILAILTTFIYKTQQKILNPKIVFQKETNYYNAKVIDTNLPLYGKSRVLNLDFDVHSVESENVVQDYPRIYPVFGNLNKNIKNILVIGAGAYTMPKYFKNYYKNADITVVEVDPEMITIGNKFFDLTQYDIKTTVGDARVVINKSNDKYDVIFGDAYNSFVSVPWHLLTKEWNNEVREKLNDGGIYAINFVGSINEKKGDFTTSVLNTFKISFPNYYIFSFGENKDEVQSITIVGIKGDLPLSEAELSKKLSSGENAFLTEKIIPASYFKGTPSVILTDNFAPVEKLMEPTIESYFPECLSYFNKFFSS